MSGAVQVAVSRSPEIGADKSVDWEQFCFRLKQSAGSEAWTHWLRSIQPDGELLCQTTVARFTVATTFLRSWIEQHYLDRIQQALSEMDQTVTQVVVRSRSERPVRPATPQNVTTIPAAQLMPPHTDGAGLPLLRTVRVTDGHAKICSAPPEEAATPPEVEYPDIQPIQDMLDKLPSPRLAQHGMIMARQFLREEGVLPARMVLLNMLAQSTVGIEENLHPADVILPSLPLRTMIIHSIAKENDQTIADIRGPARSRGLVASRHLCASLLRRLTRKSLPMIGHYLGKRDHTTILHACKNVEKRKNASREYRRQVLQREFDIDKLAWTRSKPVMSLSSTELATATPPEPAAPELRLVAPTLDHPGEIPTHIAANLFEFYGLPSA